MRVSKNDVARDFGLCTYGGVPPHQTPRTQMNIAGRQTELIHWHTPCCELGLLGQKWREQLRLVFSLGFIYH
jgi:hypothetical protein